MKTPVRKNGRQEYRQTCDYRVVNALIEAIAEVMPNLSQLLVAVEKKKKLNLFESLNWTQMFVASTATNATMVADS